MVPAWDAHTAQLPQSHRLKVRGVGACSSWGAVEVRLTRALKGVATPLAEVAGDIMGNCSLAGDLMGTFPLVGDFMGSCRVGVPQERPRRAADVTTEAATSSPWKRSVASNGAAAETRSGVFGQDLVHSDCMKLSMMYLVLD